jgi:glucose/arabinose dehydrogenase
MSRTRLRVEALEGRTTPVTLPTGFAESLLAGGLDQPTAMALAPDGRLFVSEQTGSLRVIQNGSLLPTPFVHLDVDSQGERGLLGVALDPDFAANGFVYVYHTVPAAGGAAPFNRVSRFTASGNVAAAGSEVVLLDLDPLSSATNHNGGGMHFGPDGKLYIGVGENANPANSQTLSTRLGKLLRINPDGSTPADNLTTFDRLGAAPVGPIWAVGLRNPFTFAFEPGTGRLFINDVGQSAFEEINLGRAGANYGWNITEGPNPPGVAGVTYPIYSYPHTGTQPFAGDAITGGTFYDPATQQFPADDRGKYFFADLVAGWIDRLDPGTGQVTGFATGLTGSQPVDMLVTPAGDLLYLSHGSGGVYRIAFSQVTTPPTAASVAVGSGAGGSPVVKLVDAAGTAQLTALAFDPAFTGGARVAAADVTGDGVPDLVAGAGPGGGPRVVVLDGTTGNPVRDVFAFEPSFAGGVYVAAADFDKDGFADVVVSADIGGGPRVKVLSGKDGSTLADFFGIDDTAFRGGTRVAAGDVNGDGTPDLVVAAGAGGGPRVAVFDGRTLRPGQTPAKLFNDFFAFDDTVRDGVFVAVGDTDHDGFGDVVVGAGPGGGPRVVVFPGPGLPTGPTAVSFFAGDPAGRGGLQVAARDVDGDGAAEVLTGTAAGSPPRVSVFKVAGDTATPASDFLALDASFTGGVFVG